MGLQEFLLPLNFKTNQPTPCHSANIINIQLSVYISFCVRTAVMQLEVPGQRRGFFVARQTPCFQRAVHTMPSEASWLSPKMT